MPTAIVNARIATRYRSLGAALSQTNSGNTGRATVQSFRNGWICIARQRML